MSASQRAKSQVSIHDPIHGTIDVSIPEIRLIDSREFQRLRHIKQLGFSDLAFPGATHSRYAHCLGAMEVATRIFDQVSEGLDLDTSVLARLRQLTRLAILFHDLGHPPMSHVSESVMPPVGKLGIDEWIDDPERQASHEDYTIAFLTKSDLAQAIESRFKDMELTGAMVAALVAGRSPRPMDFVFEGKDLLPLLHQIVSSEVDADRMDYLQRDAYFAGVPYGNFDHGWLIKNLTTFVHEDGKVGMGLRQRGVWAFENFLLARYHMFLTLYYHHTAICFDEFLKRFYRSGEYTLPADIASYTLTDDIDLWGALRRSEDGWASMIVQRQAFRLVRESHQKDADSHEEILKRLRDADIVHFDSRKKAALSKYFSPGKNTFPIMVVRDEVEEAEPISSYTNLYERFSDATGVARIFCEPSRLRDARDIAKSVLR